MVKALSSFFRHSLAYCAPYTVNCPDMAAKHPCWSYSEALDWLRQYDCKIFGRIEVLDFNYDVIAYKDVA